MFVFPGQGGQWQGMALGVCGIARPVFAESMKACDAALSPHLDWSVEDVLRGVPGAPDLEARRGRTARPLRGDGLAGAPVALLRGRAGRGGRPLPGRDRRRPRCRWPLALRRGPDRRRPQPRPGDDRGQGRHAGAGTHPRAVRGARPRTRRAGHAGGGERPRLGGRLRRSRGPRRARALLRGRRGAGRPDPGELREPLPPGRGGPRAAALSPRRDRATLQRAPPLLHRHRRARRHSPDGRRALVRQPAPDGALRASDRATPA